MAASGAVRGGVGIRSGGVRGGARRNEGLGVTAGRRLAGGKDSRPGGEDARSQVLAIQRSRILAAAVRAVDELGYAETSVASIVGRARISRRTFYEMFANREECLAAVLEDALAKLRLELDRAGVARLGEWRERLRAGLWVVLSCFDREPALGRVCVVGALGGGAGVLARREEILSELAAVVDEGRLEGDRGGDCTRLTADGLVGAAFAIVHARLLRGSREPLTALSGELMGLIVLPYLGPAAARRERSRQAPDTAAPVARTRATPAVPVEDPLQGLAMRLTYRTTRVLEAVQDLSAQDVDPSNRQVADHAGIGDQGQVSKLLRRLQRIGLLENRRGGHGQGEPNQWRLTATGANVAHGIRLHAGHESEAAA